METMSSSIDSVFEPDDAESRSETSQRFTVFGAAVGSIALAGQNICTEMNVKGWPLLAIILISVIGWMVFGVGVLRNYRLGKTPEGKAFFEHAHADERLNAIRTEAFAYGFAAMLGLQVVLLVLWSLLGHSDPALLSIPVAASSTIAAGVTGTVLRFYILTSR